MIPLHSIPYFPSISESIRAVGRVDGPAPLQRAALVSCNVGSITHKRERAAACAEAVYIQMMVRILNTRIIIITVHSGTQEHRTYQKP